MNFRKKMNDDCNVNKKKKIKKLVNKKKKNVKKVKVEHEQVNVIFQLFQIIDQKHKLSSWMILNNMSIYM